MDALENKDTKNAFRIVVQNIEDSQQEISKSLEQLGWLDLNYDA